MTEPENKLTPSLELTPTSVTVTLAATIPSGEYANLQPSISMAYNIPTGMTAEQATEAVNNKVVDFVIDTFLTSIEPFVHQQVESVAEAPLSHLAEDEVEPHFLRTSPLYRWWKLTAPSTKFGTFHRIDVVKREAKTRQQPAHPKSSSTSKPVSNRKE